MYGYYNKKLDEAAMEHIKTLELFDKYIESDKIIFRDIKKYIINKNHDSPTKAGKLKRSTKIPGEEMDICSVPKDSIIYLSGPITGTDDSTERFRNAAKQLKLSGFNNIINPQRLCEVYQYDADYECYMQACLVFLNHANVIMMLKGWEHSPGACQERDKAIANGIIVIYE